MDRITDENASPTLPPIPTFGSTAIKGYFAEASSLGSENGTRVRMYWLNQVTEELRNIVLASGRTPDASVLNQVLLSIQDLFQPIEGGSTGSPNWYETVKVGSVVRYKQYFGLRGLAVTNGSSGPVVNFSFPTAFPNYCEGAVGLNALKGSETYGQCNIHTINVTRFGGTAVFTGPTASSGGLTTGADFYAWGY